MSDSPRYVQRFTRKGRVFYRYNPPALAVEQGVLERCMLSKDKRLAYAQAAKYNNVLDQWREATFSKEGKFNSTFVGLVNSFRLSAQYTKLTTSTARQYDYWYRLAAQFLPKGGEIKYKDVTVAMCLATHAGIQDHHGNVLANRVIAVCRRLYSYAVTIEVATDNPWRKVAKTTEEARRVVWSASEVTRFLDEAYSKWDTRSVGLIAQMCYEWCQRVGDMRTLTWDAINFEEGYVKLVQSKRRAQVKIPISNNLLSMLEEQKGILDFQPLVAPNVLRDMNPYSVYRISGWVNKVKKQAGLPSKLRLADLRRTGTTEMCEAGVSLPQIMSVTGHSNPASVTPYMKNSLTSSTEACTLRSVHTGK